MHLFIHISFFVCVYVLDENDVYVFRQVPACGVFVKVLMEAVQIIISPPGRRHLHGSLDPDAIRCNAGYLDGAVSDIPDVCIYSVWAPIYIEFCNLCVAIFLFRMANITLMYVGVNIPFIFMFFGLSLLFTYFGLNDNHALRQREELAEPPPFIGTAVTDWLSARRSQGLPRQQQGVPNLYSCSGGWRHLCSSTCSRCANPAAGGK